MNLTCSLGPATNVFMPYINVSFHSLFSFCFALTLTLQKVKFVCVQHIRRDFPTIFHGGPFFPYNYVQQKLELFLAEFHVNMQICSKLYPHTHTHTHELKWKSVGRRKRKKANDGFMILVLRGRAFKMLI
jgi:hypothetical protein